MKKLLGIVVLGLLLSGNGYAEIIDLDCKIIEQKIANDANCTNCGKDDGLSIDLKKKKILVSPNIDVDRSYYKYVLKTEFSKKYIRWFDPVKQHEFKFNRYTYDLIYTDYNLNRRNMDLKTGEVNYPNAYFFRVKYKCKKIDKI